MQYYYSKANKGFYFSDLREVYEAAGSWPDDATEISQEEYDKYRGTPPDGKILTGNAAGRPVWRGAPVPSVEEITSRVNSTVTNRINSAMDLIRPLQFAKDLEMITEEEATRLKALQKYVVLLNRVPQQETYPTGVVWPEIPTT